jgi:hypothetical protein
VVAQSSSIASAFFIAAPEAVLSKTHQDSAERRFLNERISAAL